MKGKVAIISGSRADAGLLTGLIKNIQLHDTLELQLFVTGMHLSEQHGLTYQSFEQQGFSITDKIPLSLLDNSPVGNAIALGEGIIGFSQSFSKHQPDLIIVLGDRFEILAAVEAAMMLQIPVAHLHGGELTLGAVDDAIRHAISKMSQLHFTATETYRQRLIRMGEQPERVYNVGATAIDNIISLKLLDKTELETKLQISIQNKLFLITWHPETIKYSIDNYSDNPSELNQLKELIHALEDYPEYQLIFTKANTDSGGQAINDYLQSYVNNKVNNKENCLLFTALGITNYLSLVKLADVVIGNSSSGLLEVPAMKTASVNIGQRQDGRYKPLSVIDCPTDTKEIIKAINSAKSKPHQERCQSMSLPYGDGHSSDKITQILSEIELKNIMYKKFYNGDDC